jgi:hypothetical protein
MRGGLQIGQLDTDCSKSVDDCKASGIAQTNGAFRLASWLLRVTSTLVRVGSSCHRSEKSLLSRRFSRASRPNLTCRCFQRLQMNCRNSTLRASLLSLALFCAGCALTPHPADNTSSRAAASTPATTTAALAPSVAAAASPPINAAPPSIPPVEYAAILTEIQQLGVSDPTAQNALLEDMKRTDPTLWPQLLQTFRSSIAYHKQLEERRIAALPQNVQVASSRFPTPPDAAPPQNPIRQAAYSDGKELSPGAVLTQSFPGNPDGAVSPPPPAVEFASTYPDTHLPEISLVKANRAEPMAAASSASAPTDWHDPLQASIRTLEAKLATDSQVRNEPPPVADQLSLRMLYLAAGWRDDAVRPIDRAPDSDRAFWREELSGLATLLDSRSGDPGRHAAEARQHLQTAENTLAASAPLVLRNPAFCTEVTSFGVIKPFARYEFKPGQEVLLYAELENFASELTDKGYHTAMHSSYQIFDSRGAKVTEQDYAITEENCRNPRRDYFLRYFVYLPKQIPGGNYTLQLTIEDTLGRKAGQASVPFEIATAN